MERRRTLMIAGLAVFFFYLLFFHDGGGAIGYLIFDIPKLSLEVGNIDSHLEFSERCYSTVEGAVHNIGNGVAQTVSVFCSILDKDEYVLGEQEHRFDQITGGATERFSVTIGTACFAAMSGQQYKCRLECDNC